MQERFNNAARMELLDSLDLREVGDDRDSLECLGAALNLLVDSVLIASDGTPPDHRDGVVHHTRAEATADNEYFDGKTAEKPVTAGARGKQ
jgi:hypothetical protein